MGSAINDYIAGAVGGAAGLIVGHPFDTTKVQLQTQQTTSPYKNTWDAARNIYKQGLARGFFRGMAFPVVSYGIVNSVFFGVYGNTLNYLRPEDKPPSDSHIFLAGAVAGFAQLFVGCPVEVVKVVLQSQIPHTTKPGVLYFKGPIQCTNWLIRNRGIASLYKGFYTMALRDIPTFGVYIWVYNSLFHFLQKHWSDWDKKSIVSNLVAGGFSGLATWTPVIPFDNIKSILQADSSNKYRGTWDCTCDLYQRKGIKGFFTGTSMIWTRAFPVNAITFLVYAKSLEYLNSDKTN